MPSEIEKIQNGSLTKQVAQKDVDSISFQVSRKQSGNSLETVGNSRKQSGISVGDSRIESDRVGKQCRKVSESVGKCLNQHLSEQPIL